ncbi:hypothetical protein [Thalassoglobus polymorphus]|uniref:Leucine Rich repeats (2 copies) n=1 Tax=Thalassoglobus polymorphus TaxID=2527994 RepID=A0A517QUF5_9PLAN|nr:hypothetical protein [Thalassoglobus polymorphus]QDT35244.1 Leucine Rich repeats (2 copies) [Thalassoglobus polymorphus]
MKYRDAFLAVGMIVAAVVGYSLLIKQFDIDRLVKRGAKVRVTPEHKPYLIDISGEKFGSDDLKYLKNSPTIERLYCSNSKVSDEGMEALLHLPNLKELDLTKTAISDQTLKVLAKIKTLKHLNLSNTAVTDVGIGYLEGHPSLSMLEVSSCSNITAKGLMVLKENPKLATLRLGDTPIRYYEYCELLEALSKTIIPVNEKILLGLGDSELFTGSIFFDRFSTSFEPFESFDRLQDKPVEIAIRISSWDADNLERLDWLEEFEGKENVVSLNINLNTLHPEEKLLLFQQFPNLKWIVVTGNFSQELIDEIGKFKSLRSLSLYTPRFGETEAEFEEQPKLNFAPIAKLDRLTDFRLRLPGLDRETLSQFESIQSLREISFSSGTLQDEDIQFITKLPNLEVVSLRGNKLTKRSLEKMKQLPNLKYADLAHNEIDDKSLLEFDNFLGLKRNSEEDNEYDDGSSTMQ